MLVIIHKIIEQMSYLVINRLELDNQIYFCIPKVSK